MNSRPNPFEGLNASIHEDEMESPEFAELFKRHNSFTDGGFRYDYELATTLEILASGNDVILETLADLLQDTPAADGDAPARQPTLAEIEQQILAATEQMDADTAAESHADLDIAQRSLVLNKLKKITCLATDTAIEPSPEVVWRLQDAVINEIYYRICGGKTTFQEVVDSFLPPTEERT